jgi:hypothetical protein
MLRLLEQRLLGIQRGRRTGFAAGTVLHYKYDLLCGLCGFLLCKVTDYWLKAIPQQLASSQTITACDTYAWAENSTT